MHWIPYIIFDICLLALLVIYLRYVYFDRKWRKERREGLQKLSQQLNDLVKSFDDFKEAMDQGLDELKETIHEGFEEAMNLQVDTDGRTVWVNSESQCVARCCPVSFEILRPESGEMEWHKPPGGGLNNMKSEDYSLFVEKVAKYYGLNLTCERPKWAV